MNRKLLLLFIVMLNLFQHPLTKAQTSVYHPFPDSNAVWMETNWWTFWGQPPVMVNNDYVLFISGDTLIVGNSYKKLLSNGYWWAYNPQNGANYYSDSCAGAFREDTALQKVFYVPYGSSTEELLYDFNLSQGDTLPNTYNWGHLNYVSSIDSILVGTNYRTRYWLSLVGSTSGQDSAYASIIEGMGSTYGLLNHLIPWFESGSYLHCFTLEQQTVYQDSNYNCNLDVSVEEASENISSIIIFPNPATSEIKIENAKSKIESVEIYDVVGGRCLTPTLSKGEGVRVDVSSLAEGIYFVRIKTEKGSVTKKLIKQ